MCLCTRVYLHSNFDDDDDVAVVVLVGHFHAYHQLTQRGVIIISYTFSIGLIYLFLLMLGSF